MKTRTQYSGRLAAAVQEALPTRCAIGQVCPLAFGAMLAAAAISFAAGAAAANIVTVTTNGDPGTAGTLSLRQAIAIANASQDDQIQFAPSLVGSTITLSKGQIAIQVPMTISGPGADLLTISGNNASRIFYVRPVPDDTVAAHTPVTISGVTLTLGNAGSDAGGAISAIHSALSVSHSTISGSIARFGGGLCSSLGTLAVAGSRLTGNHATKFGGALVSGSDSFAYLSFDTISGNSAAEQGGGLFFQGSGGATLYSSTISGNTVPQPDIGSGPQGGGGAAFVNIAVGSAVEINTSTFAQNYTASGGAGVAFLDTQSANATTFDFSTIVGNSAGVDETGIGVTSSGGTLRFYRSIAANNFSQTTVDDLAGSFRASYSLIKSPGGATISGSNNLIGPDPQLGPLADHGGQTLTMLPTTNTPLVQCSFCPGNVVDQRGAPRYNPTNVGAVERQYPEPLIFRNGFEAPQ
jgi:parallel beta-helix repeat protein